jgi:carbonic anhydrase/acetyltransferase-like protein (isoleucine patch superfamily)
MAAPGSVVIGDVVLGEESSVWYGAVLRADGDRIRIGARSNVQDMCVLHTDPDTPVDVGEDVSAGHGAIIHGCRIGSRTMIGMSATIMNHASIGSECLVAAGTLVPEGMAVPDGSLIAGVPGRLGRSLSADERDAIQSNAGSYQSLAHAHAEAYLDRPS